MAINIGKHNSARSSGGFTLIELMIVVVIVAILGGIALPNYRNYVMRSNRTAAQSFMLNVASRQEQVLLDTRNYAAAANNAAFGAAGNPLPSVPGEITALYTFSVVPNMLAVPPGFTITAVPGGSQIKDPAGTLTLNQAGTRTPANYWGGK